MVETSIMPKIEIQNLVISKTPLQGLLLGRIDGIAQYVEKNKEKIEAIVWNEEEVHLLMPNSSRIVAFRPELHPSAQIFFSREDKRTESWMGGGRGMRIWEGEYEPVQFTKRNLIKFLDKYAMFFDEGVKKAIQNLRVTEKSSSDSILLDDTTDNEREIIENVTDTNLPSRFKAHLPLFDGLLGDVDFEAKVTKRKDEYGREKETKVIEIRCVNGREVIQGAFEEVLSKFDPAIPVHYGKLFYGKEER